VSVNVPQFPGVSHQARAIDELDILEELDRTDELDNSEELDN